MMIAKLGLFILFLQASTNFKFGEPRNNNVDCFWDVNGDGDDVKYNYNPRPYFFDFFGGPRNKSILANLLLECLTNFKQSVFNTRELLACFLSSIFNVFWAPNPASLQRGDPRNKNYFSGDKSQNIQKVVNINYLHANKPKDLFAETSKSIDTLISLTNTLDSYYKFCVSVGKIFGYIKISAIATCLFFISHIFGYFCQFYEKILGIIGLFIPEYCLFVIKNTVFYIKYILISFVKGKMHPIIYSLTLSIVFLFVIKKIISIFNFYENKVFLHGIKTKHQQITKL